MTRLGETALLIGGLVCLIFGLSAANSPASDLSRAVSGAPTDRALWLLILGTVGTVAGVFSLLRSGSHHQ